jgi:hypothetical protein
VSSMGIHFNVLNNATELSDGFASRIKRAQRFCNPKSLNNIYIYIYMPKLCMLLENQNTLIF